MVTMRIQLTPSTSLAFPRPSGVAFELWLLFDLFFDLRSTTVKYQAHGSLSNYN